MRFSVHETLLKHARLWVKFKGSLDRFIFEINVGKSRIRHITTLNFELRHFNRFGVDLEIHHLILESLYVGFDYFRH